MTDMIRWIEGRVKLIPIIFLFWALFWGLNGGDKFLNGEYVPNLEPWSSKGVLVDAQGDVTHEFHPMETVGLYGVNRDAKMIAFFRRSHLPEPMALGFLYGIAVLELALGASFLVLLLASCKAGSRLCQIGFLADKSFHRLVFKGSMLLFLLFMIGDNLFGERMELWEHSTFLILCLVTYFLWSRLDEGSDQSVRAEVAQFALG